MSYLSRLNAQLGEGVARIAPDRLHRHARYLLASQNPDGGFSGREGGSDLYYTGFALRGLSILGSLSPEVADRAGKYLAASLREQAAVVDFFSLLYSILLVQTAGGADVLADSAPDWADRVAQTLESFRCPDGGYGKSPSAPSGSTYHSFLMALCFEFLAREIPRPGELARFVQGRQREDGGFVEIAPMKRSGTNPTAAGVGLLQILEPDFFTERPEVREGVVNFLREMPSAEGGLRANSRIPLADLLSSFTGAWTLHQLNALGELDLVELRLYAEALEQDVGGFRGGLWDEVVDVEYTFYGLGVLGLVAACS